MTKEQAAAYVFAQAVSALAQIESMKAANAEREGRGESLAYPEDAFASVPDNYCLGHNSICQLFEDANS